MKRREQNRNKLILFSNFLPPDVQKMIGDLKKQQYLLESRLGFVSDMKQTVEGKGDMVDIREEYDEQKEKKWKGRQ